MTQAVHIVPHTHWDREWYEPFQTFRMRLVDLVDGVLDLMEANTAFAFTMDGQLATVDDYLEVRPEEEPRLRRYIAEGRLAIGPWQILMDEFLPSGETIVRNLEKGWARAAELGGGMRIGYLPDMFGHVAQMPQILHRAGIRDAVLWRGVPAAMNWHAFTWMAPDGSSVRTEHLLRGYGNAAHLLEIPESFENKVTAFADNMGQYFGDDDLLAMFGTDHATPVPEVADLVTQLDAAQDRFAVGLTTLDRYIHTTRDRAPTDLRWHGEMRSAARANVLPGVTSTRIDSKIAGGKAERALERYAEPLAALHGGAWPERLLDLAWARLIDNSAHDSICSCSLDEVVEQVRVRYAEAEQVARGITDRVVNRIGGKVAAGSFVALNPSAHDRSGLVELDVVGDQDGGAALRTDGGRVIAAQQVRQAEQLLMSRCVPAEQATAPFAMMHGRELFGRLLNRCVADQVDGHRRLTFHVDFQSDPATLDVDHLRAEAETAVAAAPDELWEVRILGRARRTLQAMVPAPALGATALTPVPGEGEIDHPVDAADHTLGNGFVTVTVEADGTLTLDGEGAHLTGVGRLVDAGDVGDTYNYGPPTNDRVVDVPETVEVELLASGPVRGTLRVRRTYRWPVGLTADRTARSDDTRRVITDTTVELRAGEPFVRLDIAFDNPCDDHRVRLHIPVPSVADKSHAAGQFGVTTRGLDVESGHGEYPLATFPASSFVAVAGVAALLDHATEYEVVDEGRELALTLLRGIGQISRNVHPYREEPAGPEIATPAAQCRGPWQVSLALYPHHGSWDSAGVATQADHYRHPFTVASGTGEATCDLPPGLEITGEGVELSALRRRDDWLEVRAVCLQPQPTTATIGPGVTSARAADLLGRPGEALPVSDGRLSLDLSPWEIRTVQLQR